MHICFVSYRYTVPHGLGFELLRIFTPNASLQSGQIYSLRILSVDQHAILNICRHILLTINLGKHRA